MGLDLSLLPYDCDMESLTFSHTVLQVERDYELYEKIQKLPSEKVDKSFSSYLSRDDKYEESHYGETIENPYGEPVVCVLAGSLKTVGIPGPTGAYINALEDDNKVALFWR